MPTSDDELYVTTQRLISPFDADCWVDGEIISRKLAAAGHWVESLSMPMYVCPQCGNKRCPKATWHGETCTGSNDPMQPGSKYGGVLSDEAQAALESFPAPKEDE